MQEAWDMGSILGSVRSPGGGHGNPLQYSCLEDPMDRGGSIGSQIVGHDWSDLAHRVMIRGRGYWEVSASSEQSLHPWDWCPNKNCMRKLLTPSSMWEYDKKISKNQEVGLTRHRTLPCLTLISIWFPDPRNVADIFLLFLSHLLFGILL